MINASYLSWTWTILIYCSRPQALFWKESVGCWFSTSFSYFFQLNAMANRAAGKGYENEDNYSNIKFQFIGIENIHVMRNSLQKMLEGNTLLYWKLEGRFAPSVTQLKITALKSAAVKMGMKREPCLLQLHAAACWLMGLVQWNITTLSTLYLLFIFI